MRLTLNFFGKSNNKFGLKKKKILFEENKIESLSEFRKTGNIKNTKYQKKLKKNKYDMDYLLKSDEFRYNNKEKDFELIKIKDYEKLKNLNFVNYFQNAKYFSRINSFRRILSSNKTTIIKNNNIKDSSKFEDEIKKETTKNKKIVIMKYNNDRKKREMKLSKIDINKIISNYLQENENDINQFNQKNQKINNKFKLYNHLGFRQKKNIYNNFSRIRKCKKTINIINKSSDYSNLNKSKYSINKSSNFLSLNGSDYEISSNFAFQNKVFAHKNALNERNNNLRDAITIYKKNFFNNVKSINNNKINILMKKNNSSIDVATNTEMIKNK